MVWLKNRQKNVRESDPEEFFLDSSNLRSHNERQFEGRVERPVAWRAIFGVGVVFVLIAGAFSVRAYYLQISAGELYLDISRNNRLDRSIIFASRGLIYDSLGREIAWNESSAAALPSTDGNYATSSFALRKYTPFPGLSHLLGF